MRKYFLFISIFNQIYKKNIASYNNIEFQQKTIYRDSKPSDLLKT